MNNKTVRVRWLNQARQAFQLDNVLVEPMGNTLRGPAGECQVGARAMDVLAHLADRDGAVVSRDELYQQVWSGRVVVDEALSRCVSELRQALTRCGADPALIKTVRGRGYQLTAAISYPGAVSPAPPDTGNRQPWLLASVLLLLLALGYLGSRYPGAGDNPKAPLSAQPRISVGSFENLGESADGDRLTRALALELEARLASGGDLVVVTTDSASSPLPAGLPRLLGRDGADYTLSGSLAPVGNGRSSLALQLRGTDNTLQGGTVLTLQAGEDRQTAMQRAINTLREALDLPPAAAIPCRWSNNAEAMELYFRGRASVQARRADNIEQGIELLRQALQIDPGFGQALATLALAYELLPHYIEDDADKAFALYQPLSRGTAEKALQVCDSLGEAWYVLRNSPHYDGDNSWLRNRYSVEHAVSLEPNNGDLLRFYAEYLGMAGMLRQAGEQYQRAQLVNPANARTLHQYAMYLAGTGDFQRALELDQRSSRIMGYHAPFVRTNVALRQGDWETARAVTREQEGQAPPAINDTMLQAIDALEFPEQVGEAQLAVRSLYESGMPGAINFLLFWGALLGDIDYIFEALETDTQGLWMPALWYPETAPIRSDPRFNRLLQDVGLHDYWPVFGPPDGCELQQQELLCGS